MTNIALAAVAMRVWAVADMSPHAAANMVTPASTSQPPNDAQIVPTQANMPNKKPHVTTENVRLPPRGMYT